MKKSTALKILILLVADGVDLANPGAEAAPFVGLLLRVAGLAEVALSSLTVSYLEALLNEAEMVEHMEKSNVLSNMDKLRSTNSPAADPSGWKPPTPKR